MARIRTVKPEFFRHEALYESERDTGLPLRLAYAGLWTAADREGRFRWAPRALKLDCLPYDDVDFSRVLDALDAGGFVRRYEVEGESFGFIPSWKTHQVINMREAKSVLPEPPEDVHMRAHACTVVSVHEPRGVNLPEPLRQTVLARDGKCLRCETKDDLTVDHIFPRSIGGTHAFTNLRTLCRRCNSARPVAGQGLIDDLAKDGLSLSDMDRICAHVRAPDGREGKGREGKGNEPDADASHLASPSPEKIYFDTMAQIGKNGRSLGAALLKAKGGNILAAHSAALTALQKSEPAQYIGAIINKREDSPESLRARGEAW